MAAPIAEHRQTLNANKEEILRHVHQFVSICGPSGTPRLPDNELVRAGLFLLRRLPTARQAVLEYLATVLHIAVAEHLASIQRLNSQQDASTDVVSANSALVNDIQETLMGFVKENPSAWSPIISTWCVDLLGEISSRSANRAPPAANLNELLQHWMRCPPTKTLIELTSLCFASMVGDAPDVCVDALLEASVKHSPHFDWVVAHIGSCFPKTIINRVLLCGLKDFHSDDLVTAMAEKVPKLASVVGILGHLAAHHSREIRSALQHLFKMSMEQTAASMFQVTIPFLLQLASMSPVLLKAIALDVTSLLTIPVINKLTNIIIKMNFAAGQDSSSLLELAVQLLIKTEQESFHLFQFLLQHADFQYRNETDVIDHDILLCLPAHHACISLLNRFLLELQRKVYSRASLDVSQDIPCLAAMQQHLPKLCQLLDSKSKLQVRCVSRLLSCMAVCGKEGQAADVMCHLLLHTCRDSQLSLVVQIQQECQIKYPDVLNVALGQVFDQLRYRQQPAEEAIASISNLLSVLKWEQGRHNQSSQETRGRVSDLLQHHLPALCSLIQCDHLSLALLGVEMLGLCNLPQHLTMSIMLRMATATVTFFFTNLYTTDSGRKIECYNACQRCLRTLSSTGSSVQKMLLRLLLEAALSQMHAKLFGAPEESPRHTIENVNPHLLAANQKHHVGHMGHQPHGTVFHGGVIGRGLKSPHKKSPFTKEEQLQNRQLLIGAVAACGSPRDTQPGTPPGGAPAGSDPQRIHSGTDLESGNQGQRQMALVKEVVARMLVELVEPDVMHTAIAPWPEEDFTNVTIERDLQIKKRFEENPILWDILEFVATGDYCMCHCSVLLRSVLATLLGFWEAFRDKAACNAPRELQTTCRILDCLRKGGLLPPPLNCCSEILHLLSPYEVHLILLSIWRFMKEYPPIPEPGRITSSLTKEQCDPQYTETLRSILHSNIDKLGHYYPRFFNNNS